MELRHVMAAAYGKKLEEASKSKVANRGAKAIADEIAATYPFHPCLGCTPSRGALLALLDDRGRGGTF